MSDKGAKPPYALAAQKVEVKLDADIILFNASISNAAAIRFHDLLERTPPRHKNVFLMLATLGGDAHAAYVIARDLQRRYDKVIICIAGDAYSAGTLIVLCAHELVFTDRGRLGPLDAQILKKDELSERLSGLTVGMALEELRQKTSEAISFIALDLKSNFGQQLSFKTALDVAASTTAQMFGEIYKQIDPNRLGEDARSLQIAQHYGQRLGRVSKNLKPDAVDRLLTDYPSHECIIDRTEAEELFVNLRSPGIEELDLLRLLGPAATEAGEERLMVLFPSINDEHEDEDHEEQGSDASAENDAKNGRNASGKPRGEAVPAGGNGTSGKAEPAKAD